MKATTNSTRTPSRLIWCFTLLLAGMALASSPSAWAAEQVPFKGRAEGAITNAVPAPGGIMLTVLASGNATQLGRFSRVEELLFDPGTGSVAGDIVFTAANGDQLFGTVAGGFNSPTTAIGTYTFTGGMGRFANATGGATFSLSTPDGVHFTVDFVGTLSSVGSSR